MQPQKRKKQTFLNIKNGETKGFNNKIIFRNLNSFLVAGEHASMHVLHQLQN